MGITLQVLSVSLETLLGGLDHKLQQGAENLSEYRSEL